MKQYLPLIETYQVDGSHAGRPLVTSRFATVFEARQSRAVALGVPVTEIVGRRYAGRRYQA